MNQVWKKKSQEEIKKIVFGALTETVDYRKHHALGVPASYLDKQVFNQDVSFLQEAPYLSALLQNPNHIGCHTLGKSESFFKGTHQIERELIEICAVDILKGERAAQDGYVSSGGTEANIQAVWTYRNYYQDLFAAKSEEICVLCSEDSHYSMSKAANLLGLSIYKVKVEQDSRKISGHNISAAIRAAKAEGKKYFVVVCNMITTMFGSVDDIDLYTQQLEAQSCLYKLHVDGAYGGFYYPFCNPESRLTFENPHISSFTLDAHKMAQAPYGTGVFIIRKNLIHHVHTKEASYVEGEDCTLIGSRSGANAIAVWMILTKNGPHGWHEKVSILQQRTNWLCQKLKRMDMDFYRHPSSNIVAIKSTSINPSTAHRFGLVADNHANPKWFKIVVMEHVTIDKLEALIEAVVQPTL
ncbi:pyridoxal-dependent decarboxylase [Cryomorphaceae bacterium 1068]|nr:pyridoxal-dependent decarboxylase [Cryomorphaceae bacterium 1068]